MKDKNTCSYSDRNSYLNAFANFLYSPKKELLTNVYETTTDCEINNICNNSLITNYNAFTECSDSGYFVSKDSDNNNLYALDSKLNEIDKITMKLPSSSYNKAIKDIAYDPNLNKIYVAHNNKIFSVNNQGDFIKDEVELSSNLSNNASICCSRTRTNTAANTNSSFNAIGFHDNNLFATYTQNGSSFIAKVSSNGNLVNQHHIDDNIEPIHTFNTSTSLHILTTKNDDYNYLYTFDKATAYKPKKNYCTIKLNEECRIDIECNDYDCNLDGSLCEVIKSIALIEKGIAEIIKCESEKIKSAIKNNSCNKELIEINNSVSKTIFNLSMLEQTLKEKLEIALAVYEKESKT